MNILQLNKYITLNGGSETVMKNLSELLIDEGHNVINTGFSKKGQPYVADKVIDLGIENLKIKDFYTNSYITKKIIGLIKENNIDTLICHNIYHHFPILELLKGIRKRTKAKVVLYLHDYKVACPVCTHLRERRVCEKCKEKKFFNASKYSCKEGSFIKSTLLALESYFNNKIFDAYRYVDLFISPSLFMKNKVREMGFKHDISVLHNPVICSEAVNDSSLQHNTIFYAGRLSEEKGIEKLLKLVKKLPDIQFTFAGGGPLTDKVKELEKEVPNLKYVGFLSQEQLQSFMNQSSYLLIPSVWYENNPMIVLESMGRGLPVIGSTYGGIPELLEENRGIIIDVDNLEKATENIEIAMKNDLYDNMKQDAKEFVINCNYANYYNKLSNIFKEKGIWE